MSDVDARITAILDAPGELGAYQRFLAETPASEDDYLFAANRARFSAHDEDVVVAPSDLRAVARQGGSELFSAALGGGVLVSGAGKAELERVLSAIDGRRTLAELRAAVGRERALFDRTLAVALGSVLFVPAAIAALEAELSGTEIVRFPGAPYEIVRNYWRNMASVRSRARASLTRLDADPLDWLRRLHVIALLGDDLATFYRPASRITQGGVRPGALYTTATRVEGTGATRLILAGPRVGVGFAGGERYHHLLARSAGDEGATQPARALDVSGVPWGSVLWGRAPDDPADAAWYCPPRPLTDAHFELLFAAYRAALGAVERGLVPETLSSLARFHYRFVRLHPFRCCNQSLAMNLVNEALTRALGAGIPHLLLDQLALRFSEAAYERLFALAATGYAVKGQPAERWRIQRDKKARAYALIERLKQATDAEAEVIARGDPEAARAALILV